MLRLSCHLESPSPGDELVSTAKGSLTFAGCCWAGGYIKGLALEGIFYRIKLLRGTG
jgi:hypothetical protein